MSIRKFYDADGADTGGGVEIGRTFSLGEMMSAPASEPAPAEPVITTQTETNVTAEPTPATPASEPAKTEAPAAPQANVSEPAKEINQDVPKVPETQPELDWKEVLKGKPTNDVLEALGIDQNFIDMLNYAQYTGDIKAYKEYLDVKTKDWSAVSDLEIMRDNLRKEYADLPEDKFEKIYKAEVLDRFSLGEDALPEEKELGEIRLSREAKRVREQLKAEQGEFKPPVATQPVELQQLAEQRQQAQQQYQSFVNEINSNEATKKLLQDKRVVLGSGENAYNFEVNPQSVVDSIVDTNKFFSACINPDGSYNLQKAYMGAAFMQNMDQMVKALIDHGRSLANKELIDTHVNPSSKDGTPAAPVNESLAQTFASRGVHTTLGAILGR